MLIQCLELLLQSYLALMHQLALHSLIILTRRTGRILWLRARILAHIDAKLHPCQSTTLKLTNDILDIELSFFQRHVDHTRICTL